MDTNGQIFPKNFTLSEAPTRVYPWIGKDGEPIDPTDNGSNDNNSASDYGNNLKIAALLTILSIFVL